MKVVWEGSFFAWHSLAHVNRELVTQLKKLGAVQAIRPYEASSASAMVYPHGKSLKALAKTVKGERLTVRHAFPPDFSRAEGPLVIMQPWEFARAPESWVQAVTHGPVHELWCNSNFTRGSYAASGVPPHKVRVLPLGYDPDVFFAAPKEEKEEFTFLYLGGTIERKGIDALMRAYLSEFRKAEPVRLLVKDTGSKHVYLHNNHQRQIQDAANSPLAPRITYLDDDLPPMELARLIRGCDAIVQPYRGEGFCLPVLEAMACGLAPIVTYGGPTDDLVLHSCGWKIASQRIRIDQLKGLESHDDQGWLEPDQADLQHILREAYENQAQTRQFGIQAAELAKQWTWANVAPLYADRLHQIAEQTQRSKSERALGGKNSISLCMIAKNEERCIGECLESSTGLFAERIVVDTGSTDRTPEICKEHGVTLRHFEWVDSFAAARNESMRDAKGSWIFWMDCDDVLPAPTFAAMQEAVELAADDVVGFIIPVRFLDGTEVDHVKLFRNIPGLEWERRIHEQILEPLNATQGRIARIWHVHVLHKNYDNSVAGQEAKRVRDWKLLELDLQENPEHPFVLFNCGMTALFTNEPEKAVAWLTKSIANSAPGASILRKTYALLALAHLNLGQSEQARTVLHEGLQVVPGDPEMLHRLAGMEEQDGNFGTAASLYQQALSANLSGVFSSVDRGFMGYKSLHSLGVVELHRGRYDDARSAFLGALNDQPGHLASALTLFEAALQRHDADTLKLMHDHVLEVDGFSATWIAMLRRCVAEPEKILKQILEANPDASEVRKALGES